MRQAEDDPGELLVGRDPDELDREAARVAARETELSSELRSEGTRACRRPQLTGAIARTLSDVKRTGWPRSSVPLLTGVKEWPRLDRTGQFAAQSWRSSGRRDQPA